MEMMKFYVNLQGYSHSSYIRKLKEVVLIIAFMLLFLVASGKKAHLLL